VPTTADRFAWEAPEADGLDPRGALPMPRAVVGFHRQPRTPSASYRTGNLAELPPEVPFPCVRIPEGSGRT
jgi:hypothetical protein